LKNHQTSNFMKIRRVGADRRRDRWMDRQSWQI